MFEKETIPLINKTSRNITSSATLKCNQNFYFRPLPNFSAIKLSNEKTRNQKIKIKKRFFSDKNKKSFKQYLQKINWEELNILNCTNTFCKHIKIYFSIYDKNFPLLETEVILKDLQTPWMSKAMKISSKQKQKLYIKFLKSKNAEDELIHKNYKNLSYENYKNLFEKLRKQSKQNHYSNLLEKHKANEKQRWQILKEITGKVQRKNQSLPTTLATENRII